MRHESKKELLSLSTNRAFPMVCIIESGDVSLCLINNNAGIIINQQEFKPFSFQFTPPISSEDNSSLTILDTELELRTTLITAEKLKISLGIIDEFFPDVYLEGPFKYEVENKSFFQDGKTILQLSSLSMLGYNASRYSYTNITTPGLF